MKDQSKSAFIFELIEEFQIFGSTGKPNSLTNEDFFLFLDKYQSLSDQRDQQLLSYLATTPNPFRVHIPNSKWIFSVASDVIWYYDELIINDPIIQFKESGVNEDNLEQSKYDLQSWLWFLRDFETSIKGGYILFAGNNAMPSQTIGFVEESRKIIERPNVYDAFERMTRMVKKASPLNENTKDNLTQLEVTYEGMWGSIRTMGVYIPAHVSQQLLLETGITYDFTTPYQRLTKEELIEFGKVDMLDSLRMEYSKDVSFVLESITNAQTINAPVLFYRDADCIAAKEYAGISFNENDTFIADQSAYNCVVPFMSGISPERLFSVKFENTRGIQGF